MTDAIQTEFEIARQAYAEDDRVTARNSYARGAALARELNKPLLRAFALRHLADIDRDADRPAEAMAHAEQSLALYRRHGEGTSLDAANALRQIALCLDALRRTPAADKAWTEARDLYATLGVDYGVAECDARLTETAE
jgi:hypothetical protein